MYFSVALDIENINHLSFVLVFPENIGATLVDLKFGDGDGDGDDDGSNLCRKGTVVNRIYHSINGEDTVPLVCMQVS